MLCSQNFARPHRCLSLSTTVISKSTALSSIEENGHAETAHLVCSAVTTGAHEDAMLSFQDTMQSFLQTQREVMAAYMTGSDEQRAPDGSDGVRRTLVMARALPAFQRSWRTLRVGGDRLAFRLGSEWCCRPRHLRGRAVGGRSVPIEPGDASRLGWSSERGRPDRTASHAGRSQDLGARSVVVGSTGRAIRGHGRNGRSGGRWSSIEISCSQESRRFGRTMGALRSSRFTSSCGGAGCRQTVTTASGWAFSIEELIAASSRIGRSSRRWPSSGRRVSTSARGGALVARERAAQQVHGELGLRRAMVIPRPTVPRDIPNRKAL